MTDDPEECNEMKPINLASQETVHSQLHQSFPIIETQDRFDQSADDTRYVHHPSHSSVSERTGSRRYSRHSDDTLHDIILPPVIHPMQSPKQPLSRRISEAVFATLDRALVFAAFGMTLSGIVVYTGGCRESYINGCLAHLISESNRHRLSLLS
jgi:hypothetical protein